ncbi:MAG TPA: hypothetical protein VLQ46_12085 [Casimicrobiaceae bacterium]|nr:hypothetical protein [Casimicrobiaceae bacterium]
MQKSALRAWLAVTPLASLRDTGVRRKPPSLQQHDRAEHRERGQEQPLLRGSRGAGLDAT